MRYKQLTLQERYQICAYKKAGYNQKEIAYELNVSESTISRELSKNTLCSSYQLELAQRLTYQIHKNKSKFIKLANSVRKPAFNQ